MKRFFVLLFIALICAQRSFAFDSSFPNNKFGIHLATPSREDLENAAKLVNSTGGDWGYITLVIQENDRNHDKWQDAFDTMRKLHLIPIVRLATEPVGAYWKKPNPEDAKEWADFLDSLRWVIKDRYIVLFNEPNHSQEWDNTINPEDYARVADQFVKVLKEKNSDFFPMLAGFDNAADHNGKDEDEETFVRRMFKEKPELLNNIEGWSSHSYPNPGFEGSPFATGRTSIRGYDWELAILQELGLKKQLPVFITETGWRHSRLSTEQLNNYYEQAFNAWNADDRVRAVTPFVLNYQGDPFLSFSWQKFNSSDFYPFYYGVQSLQKVSGQPEQIQHGYFETDLPSELLVNSTYHFQVRIHNDGQAIWNKDDNYELRMINQGQAENTYLISDLHDIRPGDDEYVDIFVKTGEKAGNGATNIGLFKGDKKIVDGGVWQYHVLPLPTLTFKVNLFPRLRAKQEREFEIQVFDNKEQLVFKKSGLKRLNGQGSAGEIRNIYLGGTYRVVILSHYYLPRQTFVAFKRGENIAQFKSMLPLDFNGDGKFDWGDIGALFQDPRLAGLFLP